MKQGIHPDYHETKVVCACGATFTTGSTKKGDLIKVEICNKCHPYYTGRTRSIATGGRIDKFKKKFGLE